jgi:hypothetical protein
MRGRMKAVHDKIDGPYAITENLALYGTIAGTAMLCSGVRLVLHGTIAGDLIIERGARAFIYGTVTGRVCNDGGRVEIFGMADAVENRSPDATTIIDPGAHVRRGRADANRNCRA